MAITPWFRAARALIGQTARMLASHWLRKCARVTEYDYVYVTHTHLAIIVFRIRMLFIDFISLIVWLEYNKKTCNIMIYDSRAPME